MSFDVHPILMCSAVCVHMSSLCSISLDLLYSLFDGVWFPEQSVISAPLRWVPSLSLRAWCRGTLAFSSLKRHVFHGSMRVPAPHSLWKFTFSPPPVFVPYVFAPSSSLPYVFAPCPSSPPTYSPPRLRPPRFRPLRPLCFAPCSSPPALRPLLFAWLWYTYATIFGMIMV